MKALLDATALGKETVYPINYDPSLLFPIARKVGRGLLGMAVEVPFYGSDVWNAYELSWLDALGKPQVVIASFEFPYDSTHLIESKSFKLYLNSLAFTRFENGEQVRALLVKDLSLASGSAVKVEFKPLARSLAGVPGRCLDDLNVCCNQYDVDPTLLKMEEAGAVVDEIVFSHLLRSVCPCTGQPDWGCVWIHYKGAQITPESLLQYIVSYRSHSGFHEQCVEHIFIDLLKYCKPKYLTVCARYTRRGGLDINPCRSTDPHFSLPNNAWERQ